MQINIRIYESTNKSNLLLKILKYTLFANKIEYSITKDNIITFYNEKIDMKLFKEFSKKHPDEVFFITFICDLTKMKNLVLSNGKYIKEYETPIFL